MIDRAAPVRTFPPYAVDGGSGFLTGQTLNVSGGSAFLCDAFLREFE